MDALRDTHAFVLGRVLYWFKGGSIVAAKHSKTEQSSAQEQGRNRVKDAVSAAEEEMTTVDASAEEVMTPEVEIVEDDPVTENPATPSEGAAREGELEAMRQQMLRVQADFDNFRRRTRQEKEDLQLFATRKLLTDLLPVADNFDRALAALSDQAAADVRTGVEMVQRQFFSVLEQYGVKAMEVLDQPFDPNIHEAVLQEPADGRSAGIIVQELQKGYELHGKVLRPAMVKVTV